PRRGSATARGATTIDRMVRRISLFLSEPGAYQIADSTLALNPAPRTSPSRRNQRADTRPSAPATTAGSRCCWSSRTCITASDWRIESTCWKTAGWPAPGPRRSSDKCARRGPAVRRSLSAQVDRHPRLIAVGRTRDLADPVDEGARAGVVLGAALTDP